MACEMRVVSERAIGGIMRGFFAADGVKVDPSMMDKRYTKRERPEEKNEQRLKNGKDSDIDPSGEPSQWGGNESD